MDVRQRQILLQQRAGNTEQRTTGKFKNGTRTVENGSAYRAFVGKSKEEGILEELGITGSMILKQTRQ